MNDAEVQEILDPKEYPQKVKSVSGSKVDLAAPYPDATKTDSRLPRQLIALRRCRVSSSYDDETSTEYDSVSHT